GSSSNVKSIEPFIFETPEVIFTNADEHYHQQEEQNIYQIPKVVFPNTNKYHHQQQSSYSAPIVIPSTDEQQNIYPAPFLQLNQFPNQHQQQHVFEHKNICLKNKENKDSQWSDREVEILIAYLDENYKNWSSGNKNKFYQALIDKNLLAGKNNEQIKNKLNKLRNSYLKEKKSTNKTGSAPTKWKWFDKLDKIFGTRENVTLSDLMVSMNQSKDNFLVKKIELQEKEIDSKIQLEKYKIDKEMELRKLELEIQREKLEVERLNPENLKKKIRIRIKKIITLNFY
ncbi:17902_t:CDS:2, partial [Entrophospora sp. SA101]